MDSSKKTCRRYVNSKIEQVRRLVNWICAANVTLEKGYKAELVKVMWLSLIHI